jgi:hypothetical protein
MVGANSIYTNIIFIKVDFPKNQATSMIARAGFENVLGTFNQSIEGTFMTDEPHKCFKTEICGLLSLEGPFVCQHRVRNKALCNDCYQEIDDRLHPVTRAAANNRAWKQGCVVATCHGTKYHHSLKTLAKCLCFDQSKISYVAFRTLLMVIKRFGHQFPLDLRRYMLFPMCASPMAYYIKDSTLHNAIGARWVKQHLITGQTDGTVCPRLLADCMRQNTPTMLRVKYKFHHIINDDASVKLMHVPFHIPKDLEVQLLTAGFTDIFPQEYRVVRKGEKIKGTCLQWKLDDVTKICDSSLLKIDQRFDLLNF